MKNRKRRVELIVDLIRNNCIGSQEELSRMLKENGFSVTQATLSRDLKMLRTTNMYILPDSNSVKDNMLLSGQGDISTHYQAGFISLEFSGNLAVIKTRNGYASGLAYDMDMSRTPEIVGTLAGTDTIFVALRDGLDRKRAREIFSRFLPLDVKIPIY